MRGSSVIGGVWRVVLNTREHATPPLDILPTLEVFGIRILFPVRTWL